MIFAMSKNQIRNNLVRNHIEILHLVHGFVICNITLNLLYISNAIF